MTRNSDILARPSSETEKKRATVAAEPPGEDAGEHAIGSKDRLWIPRFWTGINVSGWFPLLIRNRCMVAPSRMATAAVISASTILNTSLWAVQQLLFGRKINRTEIQHDPIFIIGHWRSGTTLLHELMVLDERHTYPDTYACFAPNHFLVSNWWLRPALWMLLPARRPMDNMRAGWGRPQEDEFALCNMGVPSPYLWMVFPNHSRPHQEYFNLADVPPKALARWKQKLLWFLKCVTLRQPKRIVLKSPPHTMRIRELLKMFPDARFVHIVRDPYVLFPSTMKLWQRLSYDQGLQVPRHDGLEEYIFETFNRMYNVFWRDRDLVSPSRICDVRYEDLVADPLGQMRVVYEQLELGGFDNALPALERYVADKQDYKTNRYEVSPETRAEITRRWGSYIARYGYGPIE